MPFPLSNSGYLPPVKTDKRNFLLEGSQPLQAFPPSKMTDVSHIPVYNQLHLSDCVENAISTVKMFHEYQYNNNVLLLSRRSLVIPTVIMDGFPLSEGTSVQNGLYVAHKKGICEVGYLNDDHTISEAQFVNPAAVFPSAVANATTHTIYSYAFLSNFTGDYLRNAINQNGVVLIGALINKNWWTAPDGRISWSKQDIFPIRPPLTKNASVDPSLSGHAFVLYGYDQGGFFFRNSFGNTWGDGGNNYLPNSFVPFIYEAAVLVDLTEDQILTQKEISDINAIVVNLNTNDPTVRSIVSIVKQIVASLKKLYSV